MKIDLSNVPQKTGCYIWKDINDNVIYVGKAKNLKKRMSQYFLENTNNKTKLLVKNINSFEYVLTENESSALILELNLINKFNPKYNIKLKQIKNYPYIKISKSPLKVELSKNFKKQRDVKYFGPFPEGFGPGKIKKLIESIFPVNKCLSKNKKEKKPCLNYEINLCIGYCVEDDEKKLKELEEINFKKVENFLKGNINEVKKLIKNIIDEYSKRKMFEQAMHLNSLLPILEKYKEKQISIFNDEKNIDIIGTFYQDNILSISITYIRFGKQLLTTKKLITIYDLDYKDSLSNYLNDYYYNNFVPSEIITDIIFEKNSLLLEIKEIIKNPKIGKKNELLNLTNEYAKINYETNKDFFELKLKNKNKAVDKLKEMLGIKNLKLIEMIDISNLNGKFQVGSITSFDNFYPNKNYYRRYSLDENEIQNDYQSIYDVTYRHFRRKLMEKNPLPNLFIVDGKNQISNAIQAIEDLNIKNIQVIGLIKNKKHDTSSIIKNNKEIIEILDNEVYLLLGKIQDETHRFTIEYFRNKKNKEMFN